MTPAERKAKVAELREEHVPWFNKTKKEKGCTEPLYGKKAKCVLNIVPQEQKGKTLNIDNKCIKTKL